MQNKTMLDQLPPKMAFMAGVLLTGGFMFTVGFIVVLTLLVKGVDFVGGTDSKTTKTAEVSDSGDTNKNTDVKAADPAPSGSIDLESLTNVKGTGDLTIVEYSDPECPFCKRFHATMQQILEDYDGQVRWAYKHLPLESLHPKAPREANALECAAEQDKFWEYTDLLYETTPSNNGLDDEELFTMADAIGLDRSTFDDCVESGKYDDKVSEESSEAQKLGGRGTPFSVIIDAEGNILESIPGALPVDSVAQALDSYL